MRLYLACTWPVPGPYSTCHTCHNQYRASQLQWSLHAKLGNNEAIVCTQLAATPMSSLMTLLLWSMSGHYYQRLDCHLYCKPLTGTASDKDKGCTLFSNYLTLYIIAKHFQLVRKCRRLNCGPYSCIQC